MYVITIGGWHFLSIADVFFRVRVMGQPHSNTHGLFAILNVSAQESRDLAKW